MAEKKIIMGELNLNNTMFLSYPEGFRELSREEIGQMNTTDSPPVWAISDDVRHMIVNGAYRQASSFQAFMLNAKDVATEMEKQIARPMKPFGYKRDKFFVRDAGGVQGAGFSYTYTAQGIDMCGESYVFEHNKVFYYLYFYYRKELIETGRATAEEILQSISWQ